VVRPDRGAIFLGRRQQREHQGLPRNLAAGPPVCRKSRGHHQLSARTTPVHHAEDRARTAAALSREQRISQRRTLEMGNRKPSQFLRHLRGLAPDVPATPSTYRPFSPVSRGAAWTPQPVVWSATRRSHASRRSLALVHPPITAHFCRRSRASPARWRHSDLARPPLHWRHTDRQHPRRIPGLHSPSRSPARSPP
jgi:hypothetical protein